MLKCNMLAFSKLSTSGFFPITWPFKNLLKKISISHLHDFPQKSTKHFSLVIQHSGQLENILKRTTWKYLTFLPKWDGFQVFLIRAGKFTPCTPCLPYQLCNSGLHGLLWASLASQLHLTPGWNPPHAGKVLPLISTGRIRIWNLSKLKKAPIAYTGAPIAETGASVVSKLCSYLAIGLEFVLQSPASTWTQEQVTSGVCAIQCRGALWQPSLPMRSYFRGKDSVNQGILLLWGKQGERPCIHCRVPLHHAHSQLLWSRWSAVNSQASLICYNLLTWPYP